MEGLRDRQPVLRLEFQDAVQGRFRSGEVLLLDPVLRLHEEAVRLDLRRQLRRRPLMRKKRQHGDRQPRRDRRHKPGRRATRCPACLQGTAEPPGQPLRP